MPLRVDFRDHEGELGVAGAGRLTFPSEGVPYVLATIDALLISTASLLGGFVYHWAVSSAQPNPVIYLGIGLLASFIHVFRMSGSGSYDFQSAAKPHVEFVDISVSWITTVLLLAFFAFLLKIGVNISRGAFIVFAGLGLLSLLAGRKGTKVFLQIALEKRAIGRRNIVLIGDYSELAFLKAIDIISMFGAAEVNRFALRNDTNSQSKTNRDARVLDQVAAFIRQQRSTEVLLALPWSDEGRLDFVRDRLKLLPVSVKLLPDSRVRALTNYSSSARQNIVSIEIQGAPLSLTERLVKRIMDVAIAVIALMFLAPILLMTALAIRMDSPGPVIFRQNRKGFNGKEFVMYKFRTMSVQENGPQVVQACRNDPRVTRIGRLLREASIDELPQLWNVIQGNMSVVGPRPHALVHDEEFTNSVGEYAFRHHVKPGITGWAQCNGSRGSMPSVEYVAERVKLDLWYINNWSLWLDIRILLKTFFEVMRRRNAF